MFGAIISFFGGKVSSIIVLILSLAIIGLFFMYQIEKIQHSNTKVELANKVSELSVSLTEVEVLKKDQQTKNNVITSLQELNKNTQDKFIAYKKEANKMLKICSEAKEVDANKSELQVLDKESNEKYINAINSVLGFTD